MIVLGVFIDLINASYADHYPVSTSVVHLLVAPFNATLDIVWTVTGCLVFSAFVVYDTYQISARLSPDEFIMGAISLYLE